MSEEIVIEKNIPITQHLARRIGTSAALRKMEPGDSFLIPIKRRHGIYVIAKQTGVKIVTAAQPDQMLRVWRIE